MSTQQPKNASRASRHAAQLAGTASESAILGLSLYVALVFAALTVTVDARLVITALSLATLLSGIVAGALILLLRGFGVRLRHAWLDMAGILVFFGFAAAILDDQTEALAYLTALSGR